MSTVCMTAILCEEYKHAGEGKASECGMGLQPRFNLSLAALL